MVNLLKNSREQLFAALEVELARIVREDNESTNRALFALLNGGEPARIELAPFSRDEMDRYTSESYKEQHGTPWTPLMWSPRAS